MAKFNPQDHMGDIKGKEYLEAKWRLVWFRSEQPTGRIDTELLLTEPNIVYKATIYNADGQPIASGHGSAPTFGQGQGTWKGREIEKAETAAISRALAVAGYGTQFTNELDDSEDLSDSPVERKKPSQGKPSNVRTLPPQQNPAVNNWQYGASTLQVFTKKNAEGDKRYMTVSGVSVWSRKPFEALGFNEQVLEQLAEIGEHVLPHAVTPVFIVDAKTKYKKLIQLRRDDTGEIVDADGTPIGTPQAANG